MRMQTIHYSFPTDVLRFTARKGELMDTVKVIAGGLTVFLLYLE